MHRHRAETLCEAMFRNRNCSAVQTAEQTNNSNETRVCHYIDGTYRTKLYGELLSLESDVVLHSMRRSIRDLETLAFVDSFLHLVAYFCHERSNTSN